MRAEDLVEAGVVVALPVCKSLLPNRVGQDGAQVGVGVDHDDRVDGGDEMGIEVGPPLQSLAAVAWFDVRGVRDHGGAVQEWGPDVDNE